MNHLNLQGKASKQPESSEALKEENKTEENSEDDKNDVKTEDEKSETEPTTDEKSTEPSTDDEKKEEKPDIKTEKNTRSKSKDSTENQSRDTSAKEIDEKKSKKEEKPDVQEVKQSEESEEKASESSNSHDVYTGEVHDPNINADERHNYRPINIMFRRKCQNPQIRIQFDRTVILKNQTFYLNVDGKNVRLLASPQSIETYDDIKMLLQIVDHINLSNCCVEPISHIS